MSKCESVICTDMFRARSPFFLQLHITDKCNLRCKHCYEGLKSTDLNTSLLKPEEILNLIDDYDRFLKIYLSKGIIYFTGGEPILDSNLYEYIRKAATLDLCVMILSNGTLISREKAFKLKDAGTKRVQVSLDGSEEIHNSIRGKGTFQKAIKGLDFCNEAGLDTTVMFTLSKLNYHNIEHVIKYCINHNVNRFSMGRLVPTGNGSELLDQVLTAKELHIIFRQIKKIKKKYSGQISIAIHDPIWLNYIRVKNTIGCSAGKRGICVIENGDIMPCRRLDYVIGNIRKNSLSEIWNCDIQIALRERENLTGKCGSCKKLFSCGGCRAIAKAINGHILSEDPQCFLYSKI